MTIEQLKRLLDSSSISHEGYRVVINSLINKIGELEKEIEDIKYRYVMRTDIEE